MEFNDGTDNPISEIKSFSVQHDLNRQAERQINRIVAHSGNKIRRIKSRFNFFFKFENAVCMLKLFKNLVTLHKNYELK